MIIVYSLRNSCILAVDYRGYNYLVDFFYEWR